MTAMNDPGAESNNRAKDDEPAGKADSGDTPPLGILDAEELPRYRMALARLEQRGKQHQRAAYTMLAALTLSTIGAIALIATSGNILGSDLEKSRLVEPMLKELDTQQSGISAKLDQRLKKTSEIKKNFEDTFIVGRENYWVKAQIPPELTSRLYWVDLRGLYGLAVGEKQFVYTTDGGKTWQLPRIEQRQATFEAAGSGFALGTGPSLVAWVGGTRGQIAHTRLGLGAVWKVTSIAQKTESILDIFFKDDHAGWAVGGGGLLAKTTDGGDTWTLKVISTEATLYQVSFYTDNVGVILGSGLTILTSFDGGENWTNQSDKVRSLFSGRDITNLRFTSFDVDSQRPLSESKRIVIGGADQTIIYGEITENSRGQRDISWKESIISQRSKDAIRWIERFGASPNMIAVGDNGTILVSRDSGTNWQPEPNEGDRPRLLYAQATALDRVTITGDDGYIAQLSLGPKDGRSKIARETSPIKDTLLYQISPRNQQEQVAVGDMILRREPSNLAAFAELDPETFRGVALRKQFFENIPTTPEEKSLLSNMIADLQRIDQDVGELNKDLETTKGRREATLTTTPINTGEFMWWLTGSRAAIVVMMFFIIRFLVSLYRYHTNRAAFYQARSDAFRSMRVLPGTVKEVIALYTPEPLGDDVASWSFAEIISAARGSVSGKS